MIRRGLENHFPPLPEAVTEEDIRQAAQRFPIFFLYNDFIMNRKAGMIPVSHIFHQTVADAISLLHYDKADFG